MSLYGANPEQLESLGKTLRQQTDGVDALTTTVNGALSGTTWTGPARDQFEADWNNTFKNALTSLKTAFEVAGTDCVRRAGDLRIVMGSVASAG